MNIFYLDTDPEKAAVYHCDKHVIKMILETAQLLYTAHWIFNPEGLPDTAYRKTHTNHPSAVWVRESRANYEWLSQLGYWLCQEYRFRYGNKTHKTEAHLEWLRVNIPTGIPDIPSTPLRLAMPDTFKREDSVDAYRTYYCQAKLSFATYKKRTRPDWLSETHLHNRPT